MAGRPCTVCRHPKRGAIETALLAQSDSLRAIGAQFGFTHKALANHRDNHIASLVSKATAELAASEDAEADESAKAVADHMRDLIAQLKASHEAVGVHIANKDPKVALLAHAEQRQTITALSKIWLTLGQASGELPMGAAQVQIVMGPDVEAAVAGERASLLAALAAEGVDRLTVARVARRLAQPGEAVQSNSTSVVVREGGRR